MDEYIIRVSTCTDLMPGSGESVPGVIDQEARFDENGLPYQSGTKPGLYFPGIGSVLDFGTYIKSTMTIKIKYTDDTSKVVTLHYGLFGDSENSLETPFDSDGVATITIVGASIDKADLKAGIIRCYATDTSGNSSAVKILSPLDNNDKYEWSVEAGAPEVGTLFVYAGEDKSIIVAKRYTMINSSTQQTILLVMIF